MPHVTKFLACVTLIFSFVYPAHAIDRTHYRALMQKLGERARQKDWQGARDVLTELGRELPAPTPRYLLTVASIEARLGHKDEALKWLQRFAATGLRYALAEDIDLKELLSNETGSRIAAQMQENSRPITKAEVVCSLPQADIMPEDIAYVKSSGSFFVSSIQHHGLYRVSLPKTGTKCTMEPLPLSGEASRWPTLAVAYDAKRNMLWVTASAMPGFSGFPKEEEGKALLLEIDPATGTVLHRFDPHAAGPAVLGDMCITRDGTVYVTDSMGGGVYRLHGDLQTAKLERIADGLFSPQTPVLARDGKRLLVADYTMGIAVINLPDSGALGKVDYLPHPDHVAVVALDGLYLDGDALIGIQNGTEPVRIVRLELDPEQTKITRGEIIEQASERMGDPTHAVLKDGWFYVSANVGWSKVDDNTGRLKEGMQFTPPMLLRIPARAGHAAK